MAKLAQLYGISADDARRLSPEQLSFMEDEAKVQAQLLIESSDDFRNALGARLAPMTRRIRAEIAKGVSPDITSSSAAREKV